MDFYYSPRSAPCRAVIMTAEALGVKLNKILLNTQDVELLKPKFSKLCYPHNIPTLVDDGFTLWESSAIMIYLVEKYAKDDSIYPKCPKKQAIVNQRLYFNMGTLYASFVSYYYPQFHDRLPADPELFKKIEIALEFLNIFLAGNLYAAGGDTLTIADLALLATISTFEAAHLDLNKYTNITRWYNNCKTIAPGWKENFEGCLAVREMVNL